jgi:acetyl-CoA carboxylase carboxyl transferase subunit beta
MSWLEKLLPPRIQRSDPNTRRSVPEGLWVKCPSCESVLYRTDLETNQHVCPKCDHHMRIRARERLDGLLDHEGRYEIGQEVLPVDTLKFKDSKKYPDRLKIAIDATGETDALIVMGGAILSVPVVVACFEFEFMGGSMGSVVGERFVRAAQTALEQKVPFICITATGGARMQEGLLSLTADGKNHRHADQVVREEAAVYFGADRPDHGRCFCLLRVYGGCGDRRAEGADWLCRSACDREHGARETA